jgi:hypothetical protein
MREIPAVTGKGKKQIIHINHDYENIIIIIKVESSDAYERMHQAAN